MKIGFSFGAAGYYHETSSFTPMGHICWCLKPDGTLFSDKFVIFYNQTVSPNEAISYFDDGKLGGNDPYEEVFLIQMDMLPAEVKELVFTVKFFAPEYSSHIVNVEAGTMYAHFDLTNKSRGKEDALRVLARLHKESEWILDICEEFREIDDLL